MTPKPEAEPARDLREAAAAIIAELEKVRPPDVLLKHTRLASKAFDLLRLLAAADSSQERASQVAVPAEWPHLTKGGGMTHAERKAERVNAAAQEALAPDGKATLDYSGGHTTPTPGNAPMAPPVAAAPSTQESKT